MEVSFSREEALKERVMSELQIMDLVFLFLFLFIFYFGTRVRV